MTSDFDYSQLVVKPEYAEWMHKRLVELINDFEADLPDDMQAGGRLVAFGGTTISIDDVGFWNPNLIVFDGTLLDPGGGKIQLVQHTSQLSILLVAVPRLDTSKPRRVIGFSLEAPEER